MKIRIVALIMTAVLLLSTMSVVAFAGVSGRVDVISPSGDNTDVDPKPVAPETGDALSTGGIAVLAVVCGAVAAASAVKARKR